MKHLILFMNSVETQEYFSRQMQICFENAGYNIYWYDFLYQEYSAKMLVSFIEEHKGDSFCVFTFNFNGIAGEMGLYSDVYDLDNGMNVPSEVDSKENLNIWDYYGIPVVNMVVDHPLYYHQYIAIRPEKYIQICIDKNHMEYMNRFFSDVRCEFLPLGGTQLNEDGHIFSDKAYMNIEDRPIDVLFTGNYTPKEKLMESLAGLEQDYIDFYENVLEYLKDNPEVSIEAAAELHLKQEFGEIADEQLAMCMPQMMYVDLAVRFHFRKLAIAALADAGIKVTMIGAGAEYIDCKHPENIISEGNHNSEYCLEKMCQSKICLNVMPWFKRGAHDRVYNTMLNGGVVLTDNSDYFREEFVDGESFVTYDLKELRDYELGKLASGELNIVKQVRELLADNEKMQRIADNGYAIALSKDTWKHRAENILEIMEVML